MKGKLVIHSNEALPAQIDISGGKISEENEVLEGADRVKRIVSDLKKWN